MRWRVEAICRKRKDALHKRCREALLLWISGLYRRKTTCLLFLWRWSQWRVFQEVHRAEKSYGTVLQTCSANHCLKNRRKRFKVERARKVSKAWKEYERVAKRLRTIEARKQAANKLIPIAIIRIQWMNRQHQILPLSEKDQQYSNNVHPSSKYIWSYGLSLSSIATNM